MGECPSPTSGAERARSSMAVEPKVAILMCTYQGQQYLAEQLDSFERQTHINWQVWASDDASQDNTRAILQTYARQWNNRLSVLDGPRRGFVHNFLALTCKEDIQADYYAYSDQDDIWEADKLARALAWLQTIPSDIPALYCSRTRIVDSKNHDIGLSPFFAKPPGFANALMQNIAGGNTMTFNQAARQLLMEAGASTKVVAHDWWLYMLVTGCGGQVFYDQQPSLRYRQHESNSIGINSAWRWKFKRMKMMWHGLLRQWNDAHIAALLKLEHRLTPDNHALLIRFNKARDMTLIPRLVQLKQSGVYRQTTMSNLALIVAGIFRKL
jgi:glycosyltransferase involved in cell wall biosynthesis